MSQTVSLPRANETLRREFARSNALRWVGVVAILAVLGWVLIALFGPTPDYRLTQTPAAMLGSDDFLRGVEAMTRSRIARQNSIEPLSNGENFYAAELEAIRSAKQSIHLEAYIFQKGEIAKQFVDAMTERAKAGVQVRLVIDAMGSFSTPKRYFKELAEAGGKIEWYHPLRWNTWVRSNNRTHRELLVVDSQVAFVGGAGIADHWYKAKEDEPRWRDQMFRVRGEAVRGLQAIFVENWLEASGELLAGEQYFPFEAPAGTTTGLVVDSSPSQGGSTSARILIQTLVACAKQDIQITTPYFLPDDSLRRELVDARKRGVRVRILVPGGKSDHIMTRASSRRVYGPLLEAGAEIYEYQASMIHAKIMVVDTQWAVVGSTNFDNRSFGLNDELNLAAFDPQLATVLRKQYEDDLAHSKRVSYEDWKKRPVWERGIEVFGALLEQQQ